MKNEHTLLFQTQTLPEPTPQIHNNNTHIHQYHTNHHFRPPKRKEQQLKFAIYSRNLTCTTISFYIIYFLEQTIRPYYIQHFTYQNDVFRVIVGRINRCGCQHINCGGDGSIGIFRFSWHVTVCFGI